MKPNAQTQYVTPDGRLTLAGMQYFAALAEKVRELETRLAALEP